MQCNAKLSKKEMLLYTENTMKIFFKMPKLQQDQNSHKIALYLGQALFMRTSYLPFPVFALLTHKRLYYF